MVPSDAKLTSEDSVVKRDDLDQAITSVNAAHRMVILDSGFAGAMMKGDGKVDYFVACDEHQRAFDDSFQDKRQGIFTHFLAARLTAYIDKDDWGKVQTDVAAAVMKVSQGSETPELSRTAAHAPVFGSLISANR